MTATRTSRGLLRASCALASMLSFGCEGVLFSRSRDAGSDGAFVQPDAAARADGSEGASQTDGGPSDGGGLEDTGPPDIGALGPILYPSDRRHSPITAAVATRLGALSDLGPTLSDDVFMKAGDSITVSSAFLHCFDGASFDLGGRPLEATRRHFALGDASGTSPFDRESLSARVGWSANAPLAGEPAPLEQEHAALTPRFAVVMFGTNDSGFRTTEAFARDLWTIVDRLHARGTIPLLSTIPPRDDSAEADARVQLYNLAVRAIAQGRQLPLVDFHRELAPLPNHGLAADGVHPQSYGGGCDLTETGLRYGYNVRNLLALEQLDRARQALAGEALDVDAPRLQGLGTAAAPYEIDLLPFAFMGETASSPSDSLDAYACSPALEAGPERVHRVVLDHAARLTVSAVSAPGVDVDVHLLRGSVEPEACIARHDRELSIDVDAGTYFVVVDTFTDSAGAGRAGEYLLLLRAD